MASDSPARIAVIDYGSGNLLSVSKALLKIGAEGRLEADPNKISDCDGLILPGVGAFGACMKGLRNNGWVDPVLDWVKSGKPLLGICVGHQMLFQGSEESPDVPGLGLLPGMVRGFKGETFGTGGIKVPHMGWNALTFNSPAPLLNGIPDGTYVYFVHSFYVDAENAEDVFLFSEYGVTFCAGAQKGNLFGLQFHPEKSQAAGLKLLTNFAELAKNHKKAN